MGERRERIPPVHPGEYLKEELMDPMNITRYRLAKDLGINPDRAYRFISGAVPVTPDMAIRLSRYFGTSAEFWLNMQSLYDLRMAQMADMGPYDAIKPRPEIAELALAS